MSTNAQGDVIRLPDTFFPSPSHNRYSLAPKIWPGASAESSQELTRLLRQNNESWHIYFSEKGFHNHLTHHSFPIYALGTKSNVLKSAYDLHAEYQKPAFKSPANITSSSWKDHLGEPNYYNAYMHFYADEIQSMGAVETLERYVTSQDANLTPEGSLGPQMLNHLVGGLLHPIIHVGHWSEFGVTGMLAEGLAMASISGASSPKLFPPDFFEADEPMATSMMQNLSLGKPSSDPGPNCLNLLARILEDPELEAGKTCKYTSDTKFGTTVQKAGDRIRSYARLWTIASPEEVPAKLEELAWLVTLVYGLGGFRKGRAFRCDFFLLHLVTSTLFLPTLLATILAHWISRGRPSLPIRDFYETFDAHSLLPKALHVCPSKDAIGIDRNALPANMWLPIVESALNHPEEHLVKVQRSLAHFDAIYGSTPKGHFSTRTSLPGAELLDGTIFWRVGLETQKTLGWVREGEPQGKFSRAGLGWDEAWQDEDEKHAEYGYRS